MPGRAPKASRASPAAVLAAVAALSAAGWAIFSRAPAPQAPPPALGEAAVGTATPPQTAPPAPPAAETPEPAPASLESSAEGLAAAVTGESGSLAPAPLPASQAGVAAAAVPWRKGLDPLDTTSLHGRGDTQSSAFIRDPNKPAPTSAVKSAPMDKPLSLRARRVADVAWDRRGEQFAVCACTVGERVHYAVDGKSMGSKFLGSQALRVNFSKAGGGYGAHSIVIDAQQKDWPLKRYTITQDADGRVTSVAEYADGTVARENWGPGFQPCPGH